MVGSSIGWLLRALRMLFSFGTEQKSRGVTITADFETTDDFRIKSRHCCSFARTEPQKTGFGAGWQIGKNKTGSVRKKHQGLPI
jgi:hypothetical protein